METCVFLVFMNNRINSLGGGGYYKDLNLFNIKLNNILLYSHNLINRRFNK